MPTARIRLYEKVAAVIREHIEAGALAIGERVPSVRRLSGQHRVSIATAMQAYAALENAGYIEARPKSGFYVRTRRCEFMPEPRPSRPGVGAVRVSLGETRARIVEVMGDPEVLPLGAAAPSPALLPVAKLNRTLAAAVRNGGAAAIMYAPPPGCASLRRQLARRSLEWGCQLAPEEFITTDGATEAVFLCLRALTKPGDVVALESPTYFGLLQTVESLGLRALEIPTHPRTGMDLDSLERALRRQKLAAILAVPSFNNPLGSCMPEDSRRRLADLLARRGVPLIEDDICGDLGLPGVTRPRSVKAFDKHGLVLLCGSFSKTLAPGWRAGWVAPGERYFARVRQLKAGVTLASATPPQLALATFLREGGYERHLRALRRAYANQVEQMSRAVTEAFPPGIRLARPQGGFLLWVELPRGVDAMELQARAFAARISIAPGPVFSVGAKQFRNFIRLSCGYPWSAALERGVGILGHLVRQLTPAG